jgi:hypothetical protein
MLRVLAAGALTGSIAFAVGMQEPRYLVGVLWIAARLAFVLTPQAVTLLGKLTAASQGGPPVEAHIVLLITFVLPEMILDSRLPLWTAAVLLTTAAAALVLSHRRFLRAEFTGRRHE